jgi:Ca2+-binding EF-hand superfamily protein
LAAFEGQDFKSPENLKKLFDQFDADGSGYLEFKEIKLVLDAFGREMLKENFFPEA